MKKIRGQSLTEILIALSIGVMFINVGILAMSTSNVMAWVNKTNNFALSLLKGQKSVLETMARNDWHSIADLTIGKHYKLAQQNNTWVVQSGEDKAFDEKPPVAQWTFDEGAGTVAYDNVGTNNGTLINAPTWQSAPNCVNGSCLGFDGSSNYVDAGNGTNLMPLSITAEGWIKFNGTTSWMLIDKGSGGTSGAYYIYGDNLSSCMWSIFGPTGTRYNAGFNTTFTTGVWYHLVGTFDASSGLMKSYVNGILKSTTTASLGSNTANVLIGKYTSNYYTNGVIDDVRIYDYALSDSQVKQHYNAGLNRLGLVAQWSLDEGSGTIAYDSQGTHNGTLVSGPSWQTAGCVAGGCLGFDGVDDIVQAGTGNDYFPLYNFSVCAWIKTPGLASGMVMNGIFSLTYGLTMFLNSAGQFTCLLDSGSTQPTVVAPDNLYDNQFHNVCFTYGGTNENLFIDGVNKKTVAATWSGTSRWPTNACNIGNEINNSNHKFNGSIDDVRIYNRALSPDEIANQYKDGYTRYFYVNNVSRSIASDPTVSTHNLETTYNKDHDDPNTKKIINVTRYLLGAPGRVNTQEQYLTRAFNVNSMVQNDWSGSSGIEGPTMEWGKDYANASNISTIVPGQISLTSVASSGTLTSSVIDTQSVKGAGYFNLLWKGTLCSSCVVKFQIAASNSMTGPWTYYGPTSTSDYYIPSGAGIIVPITYAGLYSANAASVQNKRYIRYQITLVPAINTSPTVTSVIINYAP